MLNRRRGSGYTTQGVKSETKSTAYSSLVEAINLIKELCVQLRLTTFNFNFDFNHQLDPIRSVNQRCFVMSFGVYSLATNSSPAAAEV